MYQFYKIKEVINETLLSKIYIVEHSIKKNKLIMKVSNHKKINILLKNELEMYHYLNKTKVNIPKLKNIDIKEDKICILLELLKHTIDKEETIDYCKLFLLFFHLHKQGIVHRDIKPENIMVGYDNNYYIIDLGLSVFQNNKELHSMIGNKRFASFHCFKEKYCYTFQDDLISLVSLCFYLKYNFLPWEKDKKISRLNPYNNYPIFQELYKECFYKTINYNNMYKKIKFLNK